MALQVWKKRKRTWARISSVILAVTMAFGSIPQTLLTADAAQRAPQEHMETVWSLNDSGMEERSRNFNKDWLFQLEPSGSPQQKAYDDSAWRSLSLPHDWSIEQDFDNSLGNSIGMLPGGTGWYRKHFTLPESYANKRVNIDFGGVYLDSYIYVNGQLVGNYPDGYVPFSFDISDYVICDGKTENVIAVRVKNPTSGDEGPTSRWYSGSGIYRDVSLTVTDEVHLKQYGTVVRTPELKTEYDTKSKKGNVKVEVKTTVENEGSAGAEKVSVRSTILNYSDKSVFEGASPVTDVTEGQQEREIGAGKKDTFVQNITAVDPKLWSVDDPNLYLLRTEILVDGEIVDTYDNRFGFSWSEFDANEGFSLNGEWMKLHGVCLHHDQGSLGAVANSAAMERQIRIMKEMGVNAIRTSHNAAAPEFMRLCDEMGVLVNEESFDNWGASKGSGASFGKACTHPDAEDYTDSKITWGEFDIQQIVRKDINSPSIILWSVGNECYSSLSKSGLDAVTRLINAVKFVDQDHPTTTGENKFKIQWQNETAISYMTQVSDKLDVVGLNYEETRGVELHAMHPEWKIYGSEQTSAIKSRGYYASPWLNGKHLIDYTESLPHPSIPVSNQLSSYDNRSVKWGRTATDSIIYDRDTKFNGGQFVWTGFDYIGEPTPFGKPSKSSYFGIVDTCGFPKDEYYLYQSQWTTVEDNPMIHIFPHWNWEDDALRSQVTYPERSELLKNPEIDEKELVDYPDSAVGKIPLRIYSNAPTVELIVKDASGEIKYSEKKSFFQKETDYGFKYQQQSETSDRLYLEFPLSWEEYHDIGTTIEAVAYDENGNVLTDKNGRQVIDTVVTAGNAAALEMTPERMAIQANGTDLAYIAVDVTDENGNFVPNAMNEIQFEISGNGKIVGVDNGNAASLERYKDTNGAWKRKAFNGKALVIVQSAKEAGSFTLTAQGAGLSSDSVTVYTTTGDLDEETVLAYEACALTTNLGTVPAVLPEKVTAIKASGKTEERDVVWNSITTEDVSKIGKVEIKGTVDGDREAVLILTVRGPIGIKPVTAVVCKEEQPQLPETVDVIWSDGTREKKAVSWAQIPPEMLTENGSFEILGSVEDYQELSASATIRVADAVEVNVALKENGGKALASVNNDRAAYLIDEQYADTSDNFWHNQLSSSDASLNPKECTAELTFKQPYTIEKVAAACWKSAYDVLQLDKFKVEYWDEGQNEWKETPILKYRTHNRGVAGEWKNFPEVVPGTKWGQFERNDFMIEPVVAGKLRFTLATDGYTSGKVSFNCTEIEAYSDIAKGNSTAELSGIQVNGENLADFDPGKTNYTVPLEYNSEIPTITASGKDGASCFILPALDDQASTTIEVTSEDGKNTSVYVIRFQRAEPVLEHVEISVDDTVMQESETVLEVTGVMEDGTKVAGKDAAVSCTITAGSEYAEIRNGRLLAYEPGTVTLHVEMTYKGVTKTVDKQVTIQERTEEKIFSSYDEISVKTMCGTAPVLPETVNYTNALPRRVAVIWETIEAESYGSMGRFEVKGTVEGISQPAVAKIEVVDAIAAENISIGVPEGYPDELPARTTVYNSDGTSQVMDVVWNAEPSERDGIRVYTGVAAGKLSVTASVRTVAATLSENYFSKETGYEIPTGIASYTNDTDGVNQGSDSVDYLNDGEKSFVLDGGRKIWSNAGKTDGAKILLSVPATQYDKNLSVGNGLKNESGGVGGISANNYLVYPDLDFGTAGASRIILTAGSKLNSGDATEIQIYNTNPEEAGAQPLASVSVRTGGWTDFQAFTADLNQTLTGTQTIYVKFLAGCIFKQLDVVSVEETAENTGEEWVAATPSFQGEIRQVKADSLEFGVMEEEKENGIKAPASYEIEYYTGPKYEIRMNDSGKVEKPGHVTEWENSPLNEQANWTEVEYVGEKPAAESGNMITVKFKPVTTYLVRLRMKAREGAFLGVNELGLYGSIASESDTVTEVKIFADGRDITEQFDEKTKTLKLNAGENLPEITASAGENAAVTVIPATALNREATVRFVPESGAESGILEYRIVFEEEEENSDLEEIRKLVAKAEELASDAQEAARASEEAAQSASDARAEADTARSRAEAAQADAKAAAEKAGTAKTEAEAAKAAAEAAKQAALEMAAQAGSEAEAAKAAKDTAELARQAAVQAETEAKAAKEAAETAKAQAEAARKKAETSESNAAEAEQNARTAKEAAQTAQGAAEAARDKAEDAARTAVDAAADAAEVKKAVDEARTAVEEAESRVWQAKTEAETARDAAETARTEAETAKKSAQEAAGAASQAARTAEASAKSAAEQVKLARAAMELAEKYAEDARAWARKAEEAYRKADAERIAAEQALADARKAAEDAKKESENLRREMKEILEQYEKLQEFKETKMRLKSVKSSRKKTARVSWKAVEGAEGYEIRYAKKASLAGNKKLTVKNGRAARATLKKLQSKKGYYVRIRAYKTVDGKKIYTKFSNRKKVRVK